MEFNPKIKVRAVWEAFDADTVVWGPNGIVDGQLRWRDDHNSSVIVQSARLATVNQVMCFNHAFRRVWFGPEGAVGKRCAPFVYMQLGDGSESGDVLLSDLVHPLTKHGVSYSRPCGQYFDYCWPITTLDMHRQGSWRMADMVDVDQFSCDTSSIAIRQTYCFSAEHATDATISEWGLFAVRPEAYIGPFGGFERVCYYRLYLNRNHLTTPFYKDTNMALRVQTAITLGF